jgi:hypothetical protein
MTMALCSCLSFAMKVSRMNLGVKDGLGLWDCIGLLRFAMYPRFQAGFHSFMIQNGLDAVSTQQELCSRVLPSINVHTRRLSWSESSAGENLASGGSRGWERAGVRPCVVAPVLFATSAT